VGFGTVILGLGLAIGGAWGGPGLAQTATYPPGGPKPPKWTELADWDSVWERGGDMVWDDRIPPGVAQTPPYNDTYRKVYSLIPQRPRAAPVGGGPGAGAAPRGGGGAAARAQGPGGAGGQGEAAAAAAAEAAGIELPRMRAGGMPGMMTMLRPMEVQVNPHEVLIVNEQGGLRRIYTDGRVHPVDPVPSTIGHSIGRWADKVLIVDTCCIDTAVALPGGGPHSDALHITERLSSPKPNMLVDEITVEDPKAFTRPWTTVKTFYRRPDWELLMLAPAQGQGGGPGGFAGGGPPGRGAEAEN
jgi:hypothetical protein